jgi:hypothetical protein
MSVRQQPLLPNNSTWTWSRNVGQVEIDCPIHRQPEFGLWDGWREIAFSPTGPKSATRRFRTGLLWMTFNNRNC